MACVFCSEILTVTATEFDKHLKSSHRTELTRIAEENTQCMSEAVGRSFPELGPDLDVFSVFKNYTEINFLCPIRNSDHGSCGAFVSLVGFAEHIAVRNEHWPAKSITCLECNKKEDDVRSLRLNHSTCASALCED